MSESINAIREEAEKYREELPNLLQVAAKEHEGTLILTKQVEALSLGEGYIHVEYRLDKGRILVQPTGKVGIPGHGYHTYQSFADRLTLTDLIDVRKVLGSLGYNL